MADYLNKVSPRRNLFKRALIVFLVLTIGLFGVSSANLFRIQIVDSEKYKSKAEKNQLHDTEIAAERGVIYDSNGTVLAQSASVWKLYIKPNAIDNEGFKTDLCEKLSEITGVSVEDIKAKAEKSQYAYLVIKRQIEYAEKEELAALLKEAYVDVTNVTNEDGSVTEKKKYISYGSAAGLDPDVKRYYPYGSLASAVIGFTGTDDIGRSGLELKYDSVLTGTPGRIVTAQNGKSGAMDKEYETVYDAVQGNSIVLTLDEVIQRYLEDSLDQVYVDSSGAGAYGIVMNVNTGAILALACVEDYDLNNPQSLPEKMKEYIEEESQKEDTDELSDSEKSEIAKKYTDPEDIIAARKSYITNKKLFKMWRNFIISDIYDPGSVFKIITASAALEENAITPDFTYTCGGSVQVADRTIKCHNHSGHGTQNLKEGLMNSCNPYFIKVGQKLGAEKFFQYFEAFGFTEKTGIDLPAETMPVAGVNYHTLDTMGIVELASSSFGQSFQVTPIQMITAISAIANGGNLMTPYLVAREMDENGNVVRETQPVVRRQVISKQTAATVSDMMEAVVSSGTGKNAYVAGYRVAGKTGTSQKLNQTGHYVASFGCFAPADDPEIAVLIIVDDPIGQINGGQICTPVAAQVVEKSLEYMGVERQYNDSELEKLDTIVPGVVGESVSSARNKLENEGFEVKVNGNGDTVMTQVPSTGEAIPKGGVIVLCTEEEAEKDYVEVPDLREMSPAQVNKLAHSFGINVKISGNALNSSELVSYAQSYDPGEMIERGRTVTVYFKSNTGVSDYSE